jgi:hypothetical protein
MLTIDGQVIYESKKYKDGLEVERSMKKHAGKILNNWLITLPDGSTFTTYAAPDSAAPMKFVQTIQFSIKSNFLSDSSGSCVDSLQKVPVEQQESLFHDDELAQLMDKCAPSQDESLTQISAVSSLSADLAEAQEACDSTSTDLGAAQKSCKQVLESKPDSMSSWKWRQVQGKMASKVKDCIFDFCMMSGDDHVMTSYRDSQDSMELDHLTAITAESSKPSRLKAKSCCQAQSAERKLPFDTQARVAEAPMGCLLQGNSKVVWVEEGNGQNSQKCTNCEMLWDTTCRTTADAEPKWAALTAVQLQALQISLTNMQKGN